MSAQAISTAQTWVCIRCARFDVSCAGLGFRSLRCHLLGPFRFPSTTCHICPSTCTPVGTSVRTGVADSSGSRRRLPSLNTQRLRHFNQVGWDGADGGLGGRTNSFRCCACQLVQPLAPAPNTHAGSSTLLSHMSLQHGGISISPRIEAISAPPAHLNVTRQ